MKSAKKTFLVLGIVALSLSAILVACKKETSPVNNPNSEKQLSLYLTDDPCQFDSVFIDIRTVEVKIDTSKEHMEDDHFGDNDDDKESKSIHASSTLKENNKEHHSIFEGEDNERNNH